MAEFESGYKVRDPGQTNPPGESTIDGNGIDLDVMLEEYEPNSLFLLRFPDTFVQSDKVG